MKLFDFRMLCKSFTKDRSGETAIQTALIFSAAIIVGVVVGVPMLDNAAQEIAYKKNFGIDTIQTSSVKSDQSTVKRYTDRKSILDK